MKVYLIQHSFNEAYKPCGFFDVVSAHSTREKAVASLETIAKSIADGTSFYFPNYSPARLPCELGDCRGYTYEWRDDGGNRMFTHFYIIEMEVDA